MWYGQRCPLFDVVHPTLPLPTTESPTLQGALKDGFGEAVVACEMSEPCQFPSLDNLPEVVPVDPQVSFSCYAHSRWSCIPSRRCGEVSSGTWLRQPGSFCFRVSEQGSRSTAKPYHCKALPGFVTGYEDTIALNKFSASLTVSCWRYHYSVSSGAPRREHPCLDYNGHID